MRSLKEAVDWLRKQHAQVTFTPGTPWISIDLVVKGLPMVRGQGQTLEEAVENTKQVLERAANEFKERRGEGERES